MNYVIHGKVIKAIKDTGFFLKKRKKKKATILSRMIQKSNEDEKNLVEYRKKYKIRETKSAVITRYDNFFYFTLNQQSLRTIRDFFILLFVSIHSRVKGV